MTLESKKMGKDTDAVKKTKMSPMATIELTSEIVAVECKGKEELRMEPENCNDQDRQQNNLNDTSMGNIAKTIAATA